MTEQQAQEFTAALGAEISYWRKRRGLSREQLGEQVGLSSTTIGRIERGDPGASAGSADVWRIAVALGITFTDLVRRSEDAIGLSDPRSTFRSVANEGDVEPEVDEHP